MQIILGTNKAKLLEEKYVVLELDQIVFNGKDPITAYCVVENIQLFDFIELGSLKEKHQELMARYRQRDWDFCLDAIEQLTGKFNGDLDTFYSTLLDRINQYKVTEPDDSWTGVIVK